MCTPKGSINSNESEKFARIHYPSRAMREAVTAEAHAPLCLVEPRDEELHFLTPTNEPLECFFGVIALKQRKMYSDQRGSIHMSSTKTKAQDVPGWAIIACPMSKCEVRHVAGIGLLMRVEYIERAEQFKTGKHTTLQFLLDTDQGLEIGGAIKKSVQALEFGRALKKSLKSLKVPSSTTSPSVLALAAESATQAQ